MGTTELTTTLTPSYQTSVLPTYNFNFIIEEPFYPLYQDNHKIFCYYGGRGGGKSFNITKWLVHQLLIEPKKVHSIVIRNHKIDTEGSTRRDLANWIVIENLLPFFNITNENITCIDNQSTIAFFPLGEHTQYKLKSLSNVKYVFIEEANFLTKELWNILLPSIRVNKAKIVLAFNPRYESEFVYQYFVKDPANRNDVYTKKINWNHNPHFPDVLKTERLESFKNDPQHVYEHIWEGKPILDLDNALWAQETLSKMHYTDTFDRTSYDEVVIAIDPAGTSKDFNNEVGIVVAGRKVNEHQTIDIIDDISGHYDPPTYAQKVIDAHAKYQADLIIIESNFNGDAVKYCIAQHKPDLTFKSVPAQSSKIARFIPVANLTGLGQIKLLNHEFIKLKNQMTLATSTGYKGPKGESPDRLDAMTWAVHHLKNLKQTGTTQTVFKPNFFDILPKPPSLDDGYMILSAFYKYEDQVAFVSVVAPDRAEKGSVYTIIDCYITDEDTFLNTKPQQTTFLLCLPDQASFCYAYIKKHELRIRARKREQPTQLDTIANIIHGFAINNQFNMSLQPSPIRPHNKNPLLNELYNYRYKDTQSSPLLRCLFLTINEPY